MNLPPLLADAGALIAAAITILIIVVPALGKLLLAMRPPQPPSVPRPQRQQPASIKDEIDEFLARASKRGPAPRRPSTPPVTAQPAAETDEPVGSGVVKQVERDLDTSEFVRRGQQMGAEVAVADAQIDKRLQEVFDHDVSKLANKPGETAAATAPGEIFVDPIMVAAVGPLPGMFSDPDSVRRAIIFNEIFQRPEHRWA